MHHFRFPFCAWFKHLIRDERGQALVETSFSASFFLLFLLGAADMARGAYQAIEVANAAKAAVQYGAQNTASASNRAAIQAAASSDAADISGLSTSVVITGACSDGTACSGTGGTCTATDCSSSHIENLLTVNTSATFTPMVQIPGLPGNYTLHGRAVQQVLNY